MIVVSNSTPLIALARIHRLGLLCSLFKRISIPPEVHQEVCVAGQGLPGAAEVKHADWIDVVTPGAAPDPGMASACRDLGAGERGAILLAADLKADLVLLDEGKARQIAREAALPMMGGLGILEAGARKGLIPDLRQTYIDLLQAGVWLDLRLLQDSLARFGLPKL